MKTIKKNYKAFGWGLIGFAIYSMLTLYIGEGFTYWLIGVPAFLGFIVLILGAKYGWGKSLAVILALMALPLLTLAQEEGPEDYARSNFIDDMKYAWSFLNWLYILLFSAATWLLTDLGQAKNAAKKFDWFAKIPKMLVAAVVAILMGLVFVYFFRVDNREGVFGLFVSAMVGMLIYKAGFKRIYGYISKRWLGLKLDDE